MLPPERKPPIVIPAPIPPSDPAKSSATIFIHGYGDDAGAVQNIAQQFQSAGKLPHMQWVFPNALEHRDVGSTAWFLRTPLYEDATLHPELEDHPDERGILESVAYITTLIDELVAQGVPEKRIIVGGFAQGHAIAFLTGLISHHAGKLGGLVGLSGGLPLSEYIAVLRAEAGLSQGVSVEMDIFLAKGTADTFMPTRYHRMCYNRLLELGVKEEKMTVKEYEGLGHAISDTELRDLCAWLEKVVPGIQ